MPRVVDQDPVQAFAAGGAHPAFGVCVRLWWAARYLDAFDGCGSPEGTAARRLPGDLLSDGPWRGARGATFPGPLSLSADQTQEKQAFRGLVACPASGTNSLVRPVAVGPLRRAAPKSDRVDVQEATGQGCLWPA